MTGSAAGMADGESAGTLTVTEDQEYRRDLLRALYGCEEKLAPEQEREYRQRIDEATAIRAIAEPLFLEEYVHMERKKELAALSASKWVWGAFLTGIVMTWLDFRAIGGFFMLAAGYVLVSSAIEAMFIARKLERVAKELSEQQYRWVRNGLSQEIFWKLRRIVIGLAGYGSEDIDYGEKDRAWQLEVQVAALERTTGSILTLDYEEVLRET